VSDPSVYGVRRDRDAFEAVLYREAVVLGLPILAICRGMQLINVLRGGTLLQQIKAAQATGSRTRRPCTATRSA
jgi:putative glutamine amidotransferase